MGVMSGLSVALPWHASNTLDRLSWSHLEHHVFTGYGISDAIYNSSHDKLLYIIGQGGCASLILWALFDHLLLAALWEKYDCIRLVAVDNVDEHIMHYRVFN
jgi:hypothetical protein